MLDAKKIIKKAEGYKERCKASRQNDRKVYAAPHEPKTVNGFSMAVIKERVDVMRKVIDGITPDADQYDVHFGNGNQKLNGDGGSVNFILAMSLPPIIACSNCSECMNKCYDICHVCFRDEVVKCRCINYAIYKTNRSRYWKSLDDILTGDCVPAVRINEGGDIEYEDLSYIRDIAAAHRFTHLLLYTKNYSAVNRFYNEGNRFSENVHLIFSAWENVQMDNPYNFPTSHIIWKEGCHTSKEIDGYRCGGNCSWCYLRREGCWSLKNGDKVFFNAH